MKSLPRIIIMNKQVSKYYSNIDKICIKSKENKALSEFFEYAGLWKDREISLDSIREKAWHRQAL